MHITRSPRRTRCCTSCGMSKPLSDFSKNSSRSATGGIEYICKVCQRAYHNAYRARPEVRAKLLAYDKTYHDRPVVRARKKIQANSPEYRRLRASPEYKLRIRFLHIQRRYGITEEQFAARLEEQKGCCAVCGVPLVGGRTRASVVVDHDHKTDAIRGLICRGCNTGIGFLQDDVRIVSKALAYLLRYS